MINVTCLNCKRTFEAERDDAQFCDARCKADFYRKAGATGKHADLNRFKSKHCEFCGNTFWFNAYGDRSGKRVPTYCCDACRLNAFRAKKRDEARRDENAKHNSWDDYAKREREAKQKQEKERAESEERSRREREYTHGGSTHEQPTGKKPPTRWSESAAYEWLGVSYGTSQKECRTAYRKLCVQHHPDKNNGESSELMKHINAAFDYLKRKVWK